MAKKQVKTLSSFLTATFTVTGASLLVGTLPANAQSDQNACKTLMYQTYSIGETTQKVELKLCDGEGRFTIVSDEAEAKKAGLLPGHVLFEGMLNEEIPGFEGLAKVPGRCGIREIETSAELGEFYTASELSARIQIGFGLPAFNDACKANGEQLYRTSLELFRVDKEDTLQTNPDAPEMPAEGCGDYLIESEIAPTTEIMLCRQQGKFTGELVRIAVDDKMEDAEKGFALVYGSVFDMDGSIEATMRVSGPNNCAVSEFRVTGSVAQAGEGRAFYLQGHQPVFDAKCQIDGYQPARFRLSRLVR